MDIVLNTKTAEQKPKQPARKQHGEGKVQIHSLDREENNVNDVPAHHQFDVS